MTQTFTPSVTYTAVQAFYILPFEDRRVQKVVAKGQNAGTDINAQARGITLLSKAWQERPFGDTSLLWHRQLAATLAQSGMSVLASDEPVASLEHGFSSASDLGARYSVSGILRRLDIEKRGADSVFGTSFSGFKYYFRLEADINVTDLLSRQVIDALPFKFEQVYLDDVVMGSPESETYPAFFDQGLRTAAMAFAGRPKLRGLAGLPAYTATPTVTVSPTRSPTFNRYAPKTATPTPGPHFINPKTGKAVSAAWNFDPEDGTPRSDFVEVDLNGQPVLRSPTVTPTASPLPKN